MPPGFLPEVFFNRCHDQKLAFPVSIDRKTGAIARIGEEGCSRRTLSFLRNGLENGVLKSGNATFYLAGISMKRRNFVFVFVIVLASIPSWAGEIFTYVDEQGSTVISDAPPPQNPKIIIKHREPCDVYTDEDRQALEKERTTRRKAWEEEKAKREERAGNGEDEGKQKKEDEGKMPDSR